MQSRQCSCPNVPLIGRTQTELGSPSRNPGFPILQKPVRRLDIQEHQDLPLINIKEKVVNPGAPVALGALGVTHVGLAQTIIKEEAQTHAVVLPGALLADASRLSTSTGRLLTRRIALAGVNEAHSVPPDAPQVLKGKVVETSALKLREVVVDPRQRAVRKNHPHHLADERVLSPRTTGTGTPLSSNALIPRFSIGLTSNHHQFASLRNGVEYLHLLNPFLTPSLKKPFKNSSTQLESQRKNSLSNQQSKILTTKSKILLPAKSNHSTSYSQAFVNLRKPLQLVVLDDSIHTNKPRHKYKDASALAESGS
ncbi:uncharacterized protein MELLADRAFT_69354 [Melampsora larici-populina 98AG31]|uniref:Uncharacterized protein n=1 Tax=Melampsora larici-populina (strain 98AG31 / pathotype 3-4-7) TaxID=747676 RepID=F4SAE3_MELLP|nr:uncharacterized protein MELLADRAFT_69354 [Melampsora larici-populina 98AG31]EGF98390.1 hypothetical protein MELLADRAFT_69354 [Melampsora larici-populina 98AG31]